MKRPPTKLCWRIASWLYTDILVVNEATVLGKVA